MVKLILWHEEKDNYTTMIKQIQFEKMPLEIYSQNQKILFNYKQGSKTFHPPKRLMVLFATKDVALPGIKFRLLTCKAYTNNLCLNPEQSKKFNYSK